MVFDDKYKLQQLETLEACERRSSCTADEASLQDEMCDGLCLSRNEAVQEVGQEWACGFWCDTVRDREGVLFERYEDSCERLGNAQV